MENKKTESVNLKSPFSSDRFEYEPIHLYYLPESIFNILESPKPTILFGSRGTGKTTLLKALTWDERIENANLAEALHKKIFDNKYIGIYLKAPLFSIESINKWLHNADDNIYSKILSFYLELAAVEKLSEALNELIIRKYVKSNVEDELSLIKSIFDSKLMRNLLKNTRKPITLKQFSALLNSIRNDISQDALQKINVENVIGKYCLYDVGEFALTISKYFEDYLNIHFKLKNSDKWHFKICFDESECFNEFQQKIINTLIRKTEWPLFYVMSHVRVDMNLSETLLDNLTNQRADMQIIDLNGVFAKEKEFKNFVCGVINTRIKYKTLISKDIKFNIAQILGKLDLNLLAYRACKGSLKNYARELIKNAELYKTNSKYKKFFQKHDSLPIYQTYLEEKVGDKYKATRSGMDKTLEQSYAEVRRDMVAAYLCLCSELKGKPEYAFSDMVLELSDGCVRDFILQMQEIYKTTKKSLKDFLKLNELSVDIQSKALKNASEAKIKIINDPRIKTPIEATRLITCLAKITAKIQIHPIEKALSTTERGKFAIYTDSIVKTKNEIFVFELIEQIIDAGYFKICDISDSDRANKNRIVFRAHCSLAANYGFSYRGAYHQVPITFTDVMRIIKSNDEDIEKLADEISDNISSVKDDNQGLLF